MLLRSSTLVCKIVVPFVVPSSFGNKIVVTLDAYSFQIAILENLLTQLQEMTLTLLRWLIVGSTNYCSSIWIEIIEGDIKSLKQTSKRD